MRIGVTGSRRAATRAQVQVLKRLLPYATVLSHGYCTGWDATSHYIVTRRKCQVHLHPAYERTHRAELLPITELCSIFPEKSYKDRNQAIVNEVEYLIAGPQYGEHDQRSQRSGTWQTVRMARDLDLPITIIMPDGTYRDERVPVNFLGT